MSAEAAAVVLARLADGAAHSLGTLTADTGLDAAALAAALELLESTGARLERLSDDSVRLSGPIDWLDEAAIIAALDPSAAVDLDLRFAAASSNDVLLQRAAPAPGSMPVCLVEFQHGGRGRRGRSWIAPPGGALTLSAAWSFEAIPRDLSALGLGIGVAAVRALAAAAGVEAGVKWPNDLVFDERKLGGILVEARADAAGTSVVAGIGINVSMAPDRLAAVSDWPRGAVDLATATPGVLPSRNRLAASLLNELWRTFATFAESGFAPFAPAWREAHVLAGRSAVLRDDGGELAGVVRDIDADGALLFESGGEVRRVLAGEVSLRALP